MEKVKYGYYSNKQERRVGSYVYLDQSDKTIYVTEVSSNDPDSFTSAYDDIHYVGPVTKFCHRLSYGTNDYRSGKYIQITYGYRGYGEKKTKEYDFVIEI